MSRHYRYWDCESGIECVEFDNYYISIEDGVKFWNLETMYFVPRTIRKACKHQDFKTFECLFRNFIKHVDSRETIRALCKSKNAIFMKKVLDFANFMKIEANILFICEICNKNQPEIVKVFLEHVVINHYVITRIMTSALECNNLDVFMYMLKNWNVLDHGGQISDYHSAFKTALKYKHYEAIKMIKLYAPKLNHTKLLSSCTSDIPQTIINELDSIHVT